MRASSVQARYISAEMHAGFANLRKSMPFNLKFKYKGQYEYVFAFDFKPP